MPYNNMGCSEAPDKVRKQFLPTLQTPGNATDSRLRQFQNRKKKTANDTYIALENIVSYFIENDIIPIIIGGSQDITYANYLAYEHLQRVINIVSIDARFDIGNETLPFKSNSYLHKIILRQPNFLFNYSNIGYQTYFVDKEDIELMDKLYFDACRLGEAQEDLIDCEPLIRNADVLTLDMSAIRFSDSPGCKHASPNGFNGKEICQLSRYAGVNHKLSSFGIYEYNPTYDIADQSAKLIAQIIWYFIDGFIIRQKDAPDIIKNNFFKYFVSLHDNAYEIIFYKSKISGLWWMEIPSENKNRLTAAIISFLAPSKIMKLPAVMKSPNVGFRP